MTKIAICGDKTKKSIKNVKKNCQITRMSQEMPAKGYFKKRDFQIDSCSEKKIKKIVFFSVFLVTD